jgi:hypothetical protein
MKESQQLETVERSSRIIISRLVFAWKKTFFITDEKFCPYKGSKLVLIIRGFETDQGVSTHCSPCVGDVVCDYKGIHIEITETVNP